jgi:hypothetical protein
VKYVTKTYLGGIQHEAGKYMWQFGVGLLTCSAQMYSKVAVVLIANKMFVFVVTAT